MASLNGFDAANTPDAPSFEALPVGPYLCAITESTMRPSKNNPSNLNLNVKWEVVDGKYKKRSFYQNISYQNGNATAQAIGRGQLKAICEAVGKLKPNASEELHGIPVVVTLGQEPRKDKSGVVVPGEHQNTVKKVQSRKEAWEEEQAKQLQQAVSQTPVQQTVAATPTPTATATSGKAPWER